MNNWECVAKSEKKNYSIKKKYDGKFRWNSEMNCENLLVRTIECVKKNTDEKRDVWALSVKI